MINIGIYGYGNLGKGVEAAIEKNKDTNLVVVFTRRNPKNVTIRNKNAVVDNISNMKNYVGKIDVLVLCGGSATDLPVQTPECAKSEFIPAQRHYFGAMPGFCASSYQVKLSRRTMLSSRWSFVSQIAILSLKSSPGTMLPLTSSQPVAP